MSAQTHSIQSDEGVTGGGVSTAILLVLILLSVTGSIATADWADNLGILSFAALGGMILGFTLAQLRRLPGFVAHLLSFILMAPIIATLITLLLPYVLSYQEKLIVLQERIQVWVLRVISGGSSSDNLIFVIQLCLIMWLLAYFAAWFVYRRRQVWGAILPTGLALLINLFYAAPQSGLWFGLYILSAMLLLVRLNLLTMERQWRGAAIGYPSDLSVDFLWYGAVFTLVLLFTVWLVPANAPDPGQLNLPEPLQSRWHDLEDTFNRAFNSLHAVGRPSASAFFGNTLTMGGPINLGQNPVMDIQSPAGRYWRATVYDKYTGIGWITTHLEAMNLDANDARLGDSRDLARIEITQTVRLYVNNQNTLYAQSQPEYFDIPTEIRYGKTPTNAFDVTVIRSRRAFREGNTYKVVSLISAADEDSLRTDSIQYSDWISATYLQLPTELPDRVRILAKQITDPDSNSYDKAAALEKYLREKIKYNDQVSSPPTGRDGVDYTLFDRPEGYCNYYASAMAVMARAVGIPARVIAGYTLGDYKDGVFHIVAANAHSWVEVYFPSYGWIEFEPTANKPVIDRPNTSVALPIDPNLENSASETRNRQPHDKTPEDPAVGGIAFSNLPFYLAILNDPVKLTIVVISIPGLLVIGVMLLVSARRSRRDARLSPAARIYERMLNRAGWLGVREERNATPLELAQAIGAALPTANPETVNIAASYTRERFSAHKLDDDECGTLATDWGKWEKEWRRGIALHARERILKLFHPRVESLRD